MLKSILVLLLAATVVSAEDSPLVALAKRTNRKASKTPVITNETIAQSKGRLSMPAGETGTPVALPSPLQTPSASATASASSRRENSAAAPTTEPGYPPSSARNIAPQSSVPIVDPQSTARTITPSSGAGRIDPQSTAQTIQPTSSARNIQPQASTPPQ